MKFAGVAPHAARGGTVSDLRPVCAHRCLSLRDDDAPTGTLCTVFAEGGAAGGISSQIAVKMAIDEMASSLLESAEISPATLIPDAFKRANARIYQYGQSMMAAAQISATGIAAALDSETCTVARVGNYDCFLWREGMLHRFFEQKNWRQERAETGVAERLIGTKPQILVDIASVEISEGDVLVLTSFPAANDVFADVAALFARGEYGEAAAEQIVSVAAKRSAAAHGDNVALNENSFVVLVAIGQEPIVLQDVVG